MPNIPKRAIPRAQESLFIIGLAAAITFIFFLLYETCLDPTPEASLLGTAVFFTAVVIALLAINFRGILTMSPDTQDLRIKIEVPAGTSPAALQIPLCNEDLEIYAALVRYGKLDKKHMLIRYHGKAIYDPKENTFTVKGRSRRPTLLTVVRGGRKR
jgi:hypothetical protein